MNIEKIKYLLFSIIVLSFLSGLSADTTISGVTESEFIYRSAPDSLSLFFHNETAILFNYKSLEVGLSLISDLPSYSHLESVKELSPEMIDYRLDKIYLTAMLNKMTITAGSFQEFFGRGLVLRSYQDKALEWDTTLNGLSNAISSDYFFFKSLYGSLPNENQQQLKDTAAGIDIESSYIDNLNLGISLLSMEEHHLGRYRSRLVGGIRVDYYHDRFDISAEYAKLRLSRNVAGTVNGQALYAYTNTYLGKLTLSAGYKNYQDFSYRLSDLPKLNSSDRPLSGRAPGNDEQGYLGQIQFTPDFSTIITAAYSEAWNSNSDVMQSDLLIEANKQFDTFSLGVEFSHLESLDSPLDEWSQEVQTALDCQLILFGQQTHIKLQHKLETNRRRGIEQKTHYPFLQYELFFNRFSLTAYTEIGIESNGNSHDEVSTWSGLQVKSRLFSHTELSTFIGKERGGKVCRGGQCFYAQPFNGIKIELITRF